jgi:two-component system, chemotaxis family, chemotaxis protein CheY
VVDDNPYMRRLTRMMLTNLGAKSVLEAPDGLAGANEFLLKPTSPKALCDRLMSIVFKPRPKVKVGTFYVPQPRRTAAPREGAQVG